MFKISLTCLLLLSFLVSQSSAADRIWTSADGKQRVKAEFAGLKGDQVQLKIPGGLIVSLPLTQFSQRDQEYVKRTASVDSPEKTPSAETNKMAIPDSAESVKTSGTKANKQGAVASAGDMKQLANDDIGKASRLLGEKFNLMLVNGLPVIHQEHFLELENIRSATERRQRHQAAVQALALERQNFGKLLELVALGVDENWVEEFLPNFIANHYPRQVVESVLNFKYQTGGAVGIWKGDNEFERRAAQQKFEREYRGMLSGLAVKGPFRICFISKAKLSPYDFTRNGLAVKALGQGGTPVVPGVEWTTTFPTLPSSGGFRRSLNVAGAPVAGTLFWEVGPDVVNSLPGRTKKGYIGGAVTERWAFIATVVTFRSAPLLETGDRQMPAIFGTVDAVELFADPALRKPLHSFPLVRYPTSVLVGGVEAANESSKAVIPLDEFALAGLIVRNQELKLHDESWTRIWQQVSEKDQQAVSMAQKKLNEYYELNFSILTLISTQRASTELKQQVSAASQEMSRLNSDFHGLMSPARQPFFPPFAGTIGAKWDQDRESITEAQRQLLSDWLAGRTEAAGDLYRLNFKVVIDPRTDEPRLDDMTLTQKQDELRAAGEQPSQLISLDENRAFDERGELELKGTETGLFRRAGQEYQPYQFLLNLGCDTKTLMRSLPEEAVKQALAERADEIRIAVTLDVRVKQLRMLKTDASKQGGYATVILDALPAQISLGEKGKAPLYEGPVEMASLQKLAAHQPEKAVPVQTKQNEKAYALSPQGMLPLIASTAPEFLDNPEQLDQLMVMRWRFENVPMFDVKPDQIRFFDKGSQSLPSREVRAAKAEKFKAWLKRWAESVPDQFTLQFDNFRFQGLDKERPSPALFAHSFIPWDGGGNVNDYGHMMYGLKHPDTIQPPKAAEEVQALLDLFAIAPRDLLMDQIYAVPDQEGRNYQSSFSNPQAIPGLAVDRPAEPIFPVLRFDKEIWPAENARLERTAHKPRLEITAKVTSFKLVEELPRHPWVEGLSRYHSRQYPTDRILDKGKYAIMEVKLQAARLVDPSTGKTVLPLELKDY
ncbi:MAG: hypothetical protein KDA74_11535, partial [Planctomycetaceae bacterium]|nr:hypothetical protein [Planctomycetaceae bacterium]